MMSDEDIKRTSIGSISIRSTASENNNNNEMMSTLESVSQRTANRRASVETIEDQTGPTPPLPMIQDAIQKAEESNELTVNELERPRPFRYSDDILQMIMMKKMIWIQLLKRLQCLRSRAQLGK